VIDSFDLIYFDKTICYFDTARSVVELSDFSERKYTFLYKLKQDYNLFYRAMLFDYF
jgi:hypothetical protein